MAMKEINYEQTFNSRLEVKAAGAGRPARFVKAQSGGNRLSNEGRIAGPQTAGYPQKRNKALELRLREVFILVEVMRSMQPLSRLAVLGTVFEILIEAFGLSHLAISLSTRLFVFLLRPSCAPLKGRLS